MLTIYDPVVLPEKVNIGSKYFETEVQSLREAVSDYLRTGICIIYRRDKNLGVLREPGVIQHMCREVAKQRGAPYVEVYWRSTEGAVVTVPNTSKTKPLLSMTMLVGVRIDSDRQYLRHDIGVLVGSTKTKVYYNNAKGLEALRAWMLATQTDNRLRQSLGLPPKVNFKQTTKEN